MDDRRRTVEEPGAQPDREVHSGGRAVARSVSWCNGTLPSTTGWRDEEPVRYLVRLIDDATSWSWGRFVERDATPQNMAVLWEYLDKNGRMGEVYTDRHAMFAVKPRAGESKQNGWPRIGSRRSAGACASWASAGSRRIRPSQRPRGTQLPNRSGSAGQAPATGPGLHLRSGECVSGKRILAGVERALRQAGRLIFPITIVR